jgi:hypothetical protein
MPILLEILQALALLTPQIPEVAALIQSAIGIATTGTVTPEMEASIRLQLDQVKALIDAATP